MVGMVEKRVSMGGGSRKVWRGRLEGGMWVGGEAELGVRVGWA